MHTLLYTEAGEAREFPLEKEVVLIGRSAECDLVLGDYSISRRHARLTRQGQEFSIRDLESKNGTSVNGVRVTEGRIQSGDELLLGSFLLRFFADPSAAVVLSEEKGLCEGEGTIIRPVEEMQELLASASGRPREAGAAAAGAEPPRIDSPAELLERMERANRRLQLLARVARTLITVDELHELLERVMDLVFESIPVERGFLMLYDEHTGRLEPQVVKRKDHDTELDNITISRTIVERVVADKVSILTSDAQVDPRFKGGESIRLLGIRSALCAPLWDREKVIGIIHADTSSRARAYTEDDLEVLTALANYATVAIERSRLNEKIRRDGLVRGRLERYHSPSVVSRIIHEVTEVEEGGKLTAKEMEVSILFADIVGFTSLAEMKEPWLVSTLLNEYFTAMTDEVFRHEGTLDKYIGDALMAVFGAPFDQPDHPLRAIETALAMLARLGELNQSRGPEERFRIRVGINSGRVIAGDIGSPKRMDYTVLGDTVNVASRLESSVAQPGQVVVGESTWRLAAERYRWRPLGSISLKGLRRKCDAYELLGRL